PLYLGLAGTMLGIIIGLFNMPDLGAVLDTTEKDLLLNKGIELLIGGVKIAMIASAAGLILTIINSGWKYKEAKRKVERDKNDFYTFLQIELLPSINNGIASTLDSLQRNLVLFKNDFTQQLNTLAITVGKMNGVFVQGNIALEKQKAILDSIDKSKVSEMTKYNVKVLQQLDVSVTQFQNFNAYLTNVNQFVENSQLILESTRMVLERTNKFEVIADSIQNRLDQSALLLDFLSAHFKNLEEQKQFAANAVADVGFAISDTFKDLKEHIQNSTEAVKRFTVDEIDALKNALSASKTNLSNLEHLATLKTDLSLFKNSSASQGERLKNVLEEINTNMTISKEILEHIEKTSISYRLKIIFSRVKKMFKAK
ncbi:MAG TPA: hypothetical protein PKD85_12465, partial [Saprospiraceae bacterium]|nr:hypothetical protein [Saprospiraceae bacterium]